MRYIRYSLQLQTEPLLLLQYIINDPGIEEPYILVDALIQLSFKKINKSELWQIHCRVYFLNICFKWNYLFLCIDCFRLQAQNRFEIEASIKKSIKSALRSK